MAITRARRLLVVYSTLRPEQIDLSRTRAIGVRHFKTFLDYAARGPKAIDEALQLDPTADFDSPFEAEVSARLEALGHTVHRQVGCAGYRIDLAVVDPDAPGTYLLGIECDGATYHSARSARDRDRIRASVLEGLGWRRGSREPLARSTGSRRRSRSPGPVTARDWVHSCARRRP